MRRIVLLVAVLAACSAPGPSGGGLLVDLSGAWLLERGAAPGGAIGLPGGRRITIAFDGNQLSGHSACNSYGGRFARSGNAVRLGDLVMTEIGCEPDVAASEAAYLAALTAVRGVAMIGDRLVLAGPGTELVFSQMPPIPQAGVTDTFWLLDAIVQGDAVSSVLGEPELRLTRAGSLGGSTGCRQLTGTFTAEGDRIVVTGLTAEGACASPELAAQDRLVVEVLGDSFTVTVSGDRLSVSAPGGMGLEYRAIPTDHLD